MYLVKYFKNKLLNLFKLLIKSDWCACGNSYGRHGKSTSCTAKCPGNTYETCGGPFTNSIYETSFYFLTFILIIIFFHLL